MDQIPARNISTVQNADDVAPATLPSSLREKPTAHNLELLHKTSQTYINAIVLMASRRAMAELSTNDIDYAEPEKEIEKVPQRLSLEIQTFSTGSQDEEEDAGLTTGKHSMLGDLVPAGRGSFLSVDIATANSTSMMFENASVVHLLNNVHRSLSVQRAKQDALFTEAHNLANSFETQAALILHHKNALDETDGMRLFSLLDTSNRGKVTMEEILQEASRGANSEAHDLIWRSGDTPLAHLRSRAALVALFGRLRTQPDGSLGVHEWKDFLALLMLHDHASLRRCGLATHRAYFGLGRGAPCEDFTVQSSIHEPALGCVDPAWLADLWYYECNHHPLLSLCCADAHHPLPRWGRLSVEGAVHGLNLLLSTIVFQIASTQGMSYLLSIAIVTVPLMIIRKVLLKLFLCFTSAQRLSRLSPSLGLSMFCVLGGTALFVLGVLSALQVGAGFVPVWVFSWVLGYVLCVCLDLCVTFNTLSVCMYLRQCSARYACLASVLQSIGLCQWQGEKNEVLGALCGECASASRGTSAASDCGASEKYSVRTEECRDNKTSKESKECRDIREGKEGEWYGGRRGSYQYRGYNKAKVLPV